MKKIGIVFCVVFLLTGFIQARDKADVAAIHKVIDEYSKAEAAGDMETQAKLMTADRIWIGAAGGGRMTNQAMNMELQQAQMTETRKMAPGIKYFYDARDLVINFFGDGKVAVASFYWYQTAIIPADTPLEIQEMIMSLVQPTAITHVLTKEGKDWKIAHTHVSFLNPIPVDN